MQVSFRNPYGFLPGQVFGLFPFDGALFVGYLLVLMAYVGLLLRHREHLLQLQLGVLALLALGTLEMAVWFFTYDSKNRSGVPTPCDVCGPVTADYVVASVLTVFKRALSRCLLLAVCLGYGVVKPVLEPQQVGRITGLGLAYAVFGVLDEVQKSTTYDASESVWVLALLVVDAVCFVWTYQSLTSICRALQAAAQAEKLKMYSQLQNVITACAAVYCVMAIVILLIRAGTLPLDWKSLFFLINFWDMLYLAVLLAMAYIWAPGEGSFRYAFYAQATGAAGGNLGGAGPDGPDGPETIDEAVEDDHHGAAAAAAAAATARPEAVGIEMTPQAHAPAPAKPAAAAKPGGLGAKPLGRPVVPTVHEDDEDEDEFGEDLEVSPAAREADTRGLGVKSVKRVDSRPL